MTVILFMIQSVIPKYSGVNSIAIGYASHKVFKYNFSKFKGVLEVE